MEGGREGGRGGTESWKEGGREGMDVMRYPNSRIYLYVGGCKNMAPPRTRQQTKRRLSRYLYLLHRFG